MRFAFRRRRTPADDSARTFDDEVRFHLEARVRDLEAAGCTPAAARARAIREFGDVDEARRYIAALDRRADSVARRRFRMTGVIQDVRFAVRRLRRAPAFAAAVTLTFAVGIGANAAMFSVVDAVLLRPLPFHDPDQLYAVYSADRTANLLHASVSPVDLDDWRAARQKIADLGGYLYDSSTGIDLTGRGQPRRLSAVFITAGFLNTLGVLPEAGRLPREDELVRGGPDRVVLLTDGFWGREFGRATSAVGSTLTLSGEPYVVLGVLPASLDVPVGSADVYVPYSTIPNSAIPRLRVVRLLDVIARARPGVTRSEVATEMSTIAARLAKAFPDDEAWDAATVEPLAATIVAPVRDGLWVLFGAVGFVLLMACANVASLQLARTSSRTRDLAVSAALGASRPRLVRQLVIEGLVLSMAGGLVGLALGAAGLSVLLALAADQLPRAAGIHVDATVMSFALAATIVAGLVSSLGPAIRATGASAMAVVREAGRSLAVAESARLRAVLVVVEVAVAMVLAVGAGLMGRSFAALLQVDPGFRPDHLIAAQFTIDASRHAALAGIPVPAGIGAGSPFTGYYSQVIERVRALPGVMSAAAVRDAPLRGTGERVGFRVPGTPVPAGQDPPTARAVHISDGYFKTIGARMIDGREFTPRDRGGAPFVLVVNEAFGRRFFPGPRVVGESLAFGAAKAEIVGVVNDIRQSALSEPAAPTLYFSNLQNSRVKTTIVARTLGDPALFATPLRDAIWSIDPAQPITDVFTFEDSISRSLAAPRLMVVLLTAFGAIGFVVGVIGVYGLLASFVNRRRREIGVRMALGASATDVAGAIVRRGAVLGLIGVAVGTGGALALTRFLSAVLYGVAPFDPATFGAMALGLVSAAVLASWLPARRAARVDPAHALRSA